MNSLDTCSACPSTALAQPSGSLKIPNSTNVRKSILCLTFSLTMDGGFGQLSIDVEALLSIDGRLALVKGLQKRFPFPHAAAKSEYVSERSWRLRSSSVVKPSCNSFAPGSCIVVLLHSFRDSDQLPNCQFSSFLLVHGRLDAYQAMSLDARLRFVW